MENKTTNILLVGVGGQGIILASEIMADVFMEAGYDVKKSEVHGMAQRGGSVCTHVRFGMKVFSPLIPEKAADILMAFEELEALRYLHYLSERPAIILNAQRLNPPSVSLGKENYPEGVGEFLSRRAERLIRISGPDLACKAGDLRAVNMVLLGAMQSLLAISEKIWETSILQKFPAPAGIINVKAFQLGRNA